HRTEDFLAKLDREIERLIQKEIEEERKRREAEERRKAAEGKNGGSKEQASETAKPKPASDFVPGATAANSPGNFASQKGKLPSPLSHTYAVVQGFGVQQHRSIKTLEVNNPGVDLETAANATARAVYPGVVSAVFVQEGLGHVVLVRHGEYLTVYANIKNLRVGKGAKLKTGDAIGSVGPSDVDPSRGQLHFEIRREREKYNPMQWLKR
ncbi:MAG: peptidoglycan DD-metalloendopeptidase family protein, partial [Muribaculaceae bacterium]|nr:peptidoglycan DD-metalloendopeptidase family protein [Muribaculaceae bacterium]